MKIISYLSNLSNRLRPLMNSLSHETKVGQERTARGWVDALSGEEFENLKKDVLRIVISTYFQKKFHLVEKKVEMSVYDIARSEKDLIELNQLSDEGWKKVIHEMVVGSLEVMRLFEDKKYKGKVHLKVALINIPILRRASFRLLPH